jgi:hypothetical protein
MGVLKGEEDKTKPGCTKRIKYFIKNPVMIPGMICIRIRLESFGSL